MVTGDTITTTVPNVNNGDVTAQPFIITHREKKCESFDAPSTNSMMKNTTYKAASR